jgi:hypothetical protein
VCERNLEGVVAKRRMGPYAEHGWLKIKNPKYTQAEGQHDMPWGGLGGDASPGSRKDKQEKRGKPSNLGNQSSPLLAQTTFTEIRELCRAIPDRVVGLC